MVIINAILECINLVPNRVYYLYKVALNTMKILSSNILAWWKRKIQLCCLVCLMNNDSVKEN